MSTFTELAKRVRINLSDPIDKVAIFREAEDNFIERTQCTEELYELDTSSVGSINDLYDLPSGFVKAHRVSWKGCRLEEIPQGTRASIYQTDNNVYTGWPLHYWFEDEQIRLIPKPTEHATLRIWYTKYNATRTSASPIIPTLEQYKLVNYVNAHLSDLNGDMSKADKYRGLYERDVRMTRVKYKNQRFSSGFYAEYFDGIGAYGNTGRYGVPTVPNEDEFIWKKVLVGGYDEYPPTEQTFTTATSPLTAGNLDSPQTSLPLFRSSNTHVIQLTTAYQDRTCFLSTEPTVSDADGDGNGNLTFGLTLSEAGLETPCYFDIKLIVSK